MLAGRIDAVKNASNYDNNSVQNQRVMRPQRGPEQEMTVTINFGIYCHGSDWDRFVSR
jgi:hypothetical protein